VRPAAQPTAAGVPVAPSAGGSATTEGDENFTVASRLLPQALQRDLRAVYDVARAIDDLGDDAAGDRMRLLDEYDADLRRVWVSGDPQRAELRRLVVTVAARRLAMAPFLDLVEANRLDQVQSAYPTWADLRHYCSLSADPVGRIVLEVFAASTEQRVAWSDDVCTALQVLEHCQDVAEDRRRGRTYLPAEDLARHGVADDDLDATVTSAAVRSVIGHEVYRARQLLASGRPLVRSLRGLGRWAVAGYVAGGLATADALQRNDFDVLAPGRSLQPRRLDTLRHAAALVAGR
jgi:squalene synthase HpnC